MFQMYIKVNCIHYIYLFIRKAFCHSNNSDAGFRYQYSSHVVKKLDSRTSFYYKLENEKIVMNTTLNKTEWSLKVPKRMKFWRKFNLAVVEIQNFN